VHDARFDAFCRLQSVAREIRESSERADEPIISKSELLQARDDLA
jgi:hypothetical protein